MKFKFCPYLTFLKIIDLSQAHGVVSSKSILKCITKLTVCKIYPNWQTLSQNEYSLPKIKVFNRR